MKLVVIHYEGLIITGTEEPVDSLVITTSRAKYNGYCEFSWETGQLMDDIDIGYMVFTRL